MKFAPSELEYLRSIATRLIPDDEAPAAPAIAVDAVNELVSAAASGVQAADHCLKLLAIRGMTDIVKAILSEQRVKLGWSGHAVSLPARMSTGATSGWQRPLWKELSWEEAQCIRDRLAAHSDKLGADVAVLDRVLACQDRYASPYEAATAEGLDLTDLRTG